MLQGRHRLRGRRLGSRSRDRTGFPVFDIPNWIIRLIVLLIILGLPIALVLAWTFELTPQGIKRTETADAMPETARQKKHTWIYVVL